MLARSAAALATLAAAAAQVSPWSVEGGDMYRTSARTLVMDVTQTSPRTVWKLSEPVDTDISEIEDALLQQPLVTSWGAIVIVTDNGQLYQYADPANLVAAATSWAPSAGPWSGWKALPLPDGETPPDFVYGGAVLDSNDVLYIVEQRARAVRAVQLTASAPYFSELPNSPFYFDSTKRFKFPETASLLLVPQPNSAQMQLWIPINGDLLGVDGFAIVFDTAYFLNGAIAPFFAPLPAGSCRFPEDSGSVAIPSNRVTSSAGALILSQLDCGAAIYTADLGSQTATVKWTTSPGVYAFSTEGEHAHPVYDAGTDSLLWVDYSARFGSPQQLCCAKIYNGFGTCDNWNGQCFNLPAESFNPDTELFTQWDWLALAVSGGNVYISAGGYTDIFLGDTHGMMVAYSIGGGGTLLGKWRTESDMFNSAPLVVNNQRVYVTSTRGGLYAFDAANPGAGPVWTTRGEVAAIPDEDLPQSTYCYLTVTSTGTLLVTASAGGKDWSDEKAIYAIVNGVQVPPSTGGGGGNVGAIVGGVSAALVLTAAAGFAYFKVGAFKGAVDGALGAVKAAVTGGGKSYASVGFASDSGAAFTGSTSASSASSSAGGVGAGGFNSGGYGGV